MEISWLAQDLVTWNCVTRKPALLREDHSIWETCAPEERASPHIWSLEIGWQGVWATNIWGYLDLCLVPPGGKGFAPLHIEKSSEINKKLFPSFLVVIKCCDAQLFPKWIPIGKNKDFDFNKATEKSMWPIGIVITVNIILGILFITSLSKTCTDKNKIENIMFALITELISIVFLKRKPLNKNSSTATDDVICGVP